MGNFKGIKRASAFGLMVTAMVAISACSDSDSGTGSTYECQTPGGCDDPSHILTSSSSSVYDIVPGYSSEALPGSSAEIAEGYSSSSEIPPVGLSSSFSELPEVSSSSVVFDSAFFGGIEPRSSSSHAIPDHDRGSSGMEPPRSSSSHVIPSSSSHVIPDHDRGSSSVEPPPSSSSAPALPQYAKILGVDISQMQEFEAKGTRVLDTDGTPKDVFELFRDHGFNYIRLKTFVGPKSKYGYAAGSCDQGAGTFGSNSEAFGDKDHVIAYAKRAKAAGMKLLLDFHYSDNWADPGKQIIPERWRNISSSDVLADSVYAYTKDVLTALKNAGALPEMVQVGNEITNGLLRDVPNGSTDCWGNNVDLANSSVSGVMSNATGIANTAKYLAAGSRAVKEISSSIKTVFHIESPHKTSTVEWWMKSIIQNSKVTPDVMAFSAYTAYEHGNPDSWKTLMTNLGKTYTSLEFLIAEYNGAQTKDSYSFDGSRAKTQKVMEQVPRGLGAFIWEPERSGAWGTSMFDWVGNDLKANQRAFDEYKVLF